MRSRTACILAAVAILPMLLGCGVQEVKQPKRPVDAILEFDENAIVLELREPDDLCTRSEYGAAAAPEPGAVEIPCWAGH